MVVYSTTVLQCLLLERPRCCGCGCCYWCCCCCHFWQVKDGLSASSAPSRVSPTQLPLRTCSAACMAARQVLRRPLALRMCGPLSTRIHHASCHHVMCLFDTWHSSGNEFASSSCSPWAFTSPSCPSWAFTSLSCAPGPQLLCLAQLVLLEHSLLSRSS